MKRTHRQVVGMMLANDSLRTEVIEGIEAVRIIEVLLISTVASLNLVVMPGTIGTNQLVADVEFVSGLLKERGEIALGVRELVGEFKTVIGLNTFHPDAQSGELTHDGFKEAGGGVGTLFRISAEDAIAGELIDGGDWYSLSFGSAMQRSETTFASI